MKTLPKDMDIECIELCNLLNSLPTVETMESCCGHCKDEYSIWFYCNSIAVLSRLARSVSKNYSDGKWELLVDTCDTKPYGLFWLRSKKPFVSSEEMVKSVSALIDNIKYWFNDKFDEYFEEKPSCRERKLDHNTESVDLEKEIDKTFRECTDDGYNFDWDRFARHFYNLGRNSLEFLEKHKEKI